MDRYILGHCRLRSPPTSRQRAYHEVVRGPFEGRADSSRDVRVCTCMCVVWLIVRTRGRLLLSPCCSATAVGLSGRERTCVGACWWRKLRARLCCVYILVCMYRSSTEPDRPAGRLAGRTPPNLQGRASWNRSHCMSACLVAQRSEAEEEHTIRV